MKTARITFATTLALSLVIGAEAAGSPETVAVPIGPPGGSTDAVAVSQGGATLYVDTPAAGLFRSDDRGASWLRLAARAPGVTSQLAVDSGDHSTVYAATSAGLFRSRNAGGSWQGLNPRIPGVQGCAPETQGCGRAVALTADPLRPGTLLVAFGARGPVVQTTDGGDSWSSIGSGLAGVTISRLVPFPFRPGTFYAASSRGIRVTHDDGASWHPDGLKAYPVLSVAADAGRQGDAFAVTSHYGGLFTSSWRRESANGRFNGGNGFFPLWFDGISFSTDPLVPGLILAAAPKGTLRTGNFALSWQRVDPRPTLSILTPYAAPGSFFAQAGPDEGTALLLSDDAGVTWKPAGVGVAAQSARQLVPDPNRDGTLYVRTARAALRRSDDGGLHWRRILAPQPSDDEARFVLDPFDSARLYMASPDALLRSTDRGEHWSAIRNDHVQAVAADPNLRATLYVMSADHGFLRSRDGGESWTATGQFAQRWTFGLVAAPRNGAPAALYLATLDRRDAARRCILYRSLDGGESWTELLRTRQPNSPITAIVEVPGRPNEIFAAFADVKTFQGKPLDGGIYRSVDGGAAWQLLSLDDDRSPALSLLVDPSASDHLFAGSTRGRTFESRNAGNSWTLLSTSLPEADVRDLQFDPRDPSILFAALDGASVFRLELER